MGRIAASRGSRVLLVSALTLMMGAASTPFANADGSPILLSSNDHGEKLTCGSTWGDVYRLDGTTLTRLTNARQQTPDADAYCQIGYSRPVLSPDGARIVAMRYEGSSTSIVVMNADGTDPRVVSHPDEHHARSASWSPDGTQLVHDGHDRPGLKLVSVDGSGASIIPNTEFYADPAWSPDGEWIAFSFVPQQDNPDQRAAIGVIHPDGSEFRQVTLDPSTAAAARPSWSPDGTAIAFETQLEGCGGKHISIVPFKGSRTYEALSLPDGMCEAGAPWWLNDDQLVYWGTIGTGTSDIYEGSRSDASFSLQLTSTSGAELDPSAAPRLGAVSPAAGQSTSTRALDGSRTGARRSPAVPILLAIVALVLVAGAVVARRRVLATAGAIGARAPRERDRRPSDHTACVDRWEEATRTATAAREAAGRKLGDALAEISREWDGVLVALEQARAAFSAIDTTEDSPAPEPADDEEAVVQHLLDGVSRAIQGEQS